VYCLTDCAWSMAVIKRWHGQSRWDLDSSSLNPDREEVVGGGILDMVMQECAREVNVIYHELMSLLGLSNERFGSQLIFPCSSWWRSQLKERRRPCKLEELKIWAHERQNSIQICAWRFAACLESLSVLLCTRASCSRLPRSRFYYYRLSSFCLSYSRFLLRIVHYLTL